MSCKKFKKNRQGYFRCSLNILFVGISCIPRRAYLNLLCHCYGVKLIRLLKVDHVLSSLEFMQ